MRKVAFFTLGCKVNQFETAAMQRQFEAAGFEVVTADGPADVYVVNSCTVTGTGDQKSRQALRRMRRRNPSAVVCLCGCFPQAFPDAAKDIPEVDIIMGAKDRFKLLDAVLQRLEGGGRIVDIAPYVPGEAFEPLAAGGLGSRTRAFLKIEDGCRRLCAYCIIPTARGPVRSKPPGEIARELRALADSGYREAVLVGVNLSCYGQDLGLRLIDAVNVAASAGGILRLRLGSLEPELLTTGDIEELAKLDSLCPQFHLSLQSGCDATLRRMRRMYTAGEYRRIADDLRAAFPRCALTTDIMVGFPGETDADFAESLAFCREIGFAKTHVFAYSKRPGTVAAAMPGQVPERVKRERSTVMIAAMDKIRAEFLARQLGSPASVLFETQRPDSRWEGYSENYSPVLTAGEALAGKIITVTPTRLEGDYCVVPEL